MGGKGSPDVPGIARNNRDALFQTILFDISAGQLCQPFLNFQAYPAGQGMPSGHDQRENSVAAAQIQIDGPWFYRNKPRQHQGIQRKPVASCALADFQTSAQDFVIRFFFRHFAALRREEWRLFWAGLPAS